VTGSCPANQHCCDGMGCVSNTQTCGITPL
jgi:hypothetical protein